MRARRAAAPRFSDEFWEADDDLTFWRMVRDELRHTGRLRDEATALLVDPAQANVVPITIGGSATTRHSRAGAVRARPATPSEVDTAVVA